MLVMKKEIEKKEILPILVGFLYFAITEISIFLGIFGIPRELIYGLFFLFFFLYALKYIKHLDTFDWLIIFLLLAVVVTGMIGYSKYVVSLTNKLAPLLIFFPAYIFFRLYTFTRLEDMFEKAGLFAGIILLFYYFVIIRNTGATYSMSYAYWVAFPIVVYLSAFLETKKPIFIIGFSVLFTTLFVSGSRGALFLTILCVFYLLLLVTLEKGMTPRKIFGLSCLGIAAFVVVNLNNKILLFLSQFSSSSRNIRIILSGGMFESPARERIYETCRQLIRQNRWGYGPLASRQLLLGHNYPHSLWYELQLDYGQFLGILIFALIILTVFYNLYKYRDKKERALVAYICIVGIGSLMVSSSYLYEICVPAVMAMAINWNKYYKQRV